MGTYKRLKADNIKSSNEYDKRWVEKLNSLAEIEMFFGGKLMFLETIRDQIELGDAICNESGISVELKHDLLFRKTGNLFFEFKELLGDESNWIQSGFLSSSAASYLIQGDMDKFYVFDVKDLESTFKNEKYDRLVGSKSLGGLGFYTSSGMLIKEINAAKIAKWKQE